jgi:hypothetical protein
MSQRNYLYALLTGLLLVSSFSLVFAKSPGNSSKDPFTVQGASRSSDGKTDCLPGLKGTATARNTATTSSNRPILNSYYPRYLSAKAVLVFTSIVGGRGQLVAQSDFMEAYGGNQGALPANTTYEYNCVDFQNLYSAALGYGFHKALPASDDPTPNGGKSVVYSDSAGGQYSYQPW